jgi:ABC-type transport system substrate-binding protein
MTFKKVGMLLLSALAIGGLASCGGNNNGGDQKEYDGSKNNDFEVGGKVILGNGTELSGDFRFPGVASSSVGASDQDIVGLTNGYATMELDKNGDYKRNNTVVKNHTEEEVDSAGGGKNLKVTIELKPGLKFSDGTEVKAANYLAYTLAFSTPVGKAAFGSDTSGQAIVGFDTYNKYTGVEVTG